MTLRPALLPYARYAVLLVTGLLASVLIFQTYRYERDFVTVAMDWKSVALVGSSVFVLASIFSLVSRRVLASIALACALMILLTIISVVKFSYLRSSLYALDLYYYIRPTELIFFYEHFPRVFFAGLATIVAAGAITWLLFVVDDTRAPRKLNLIILGCAILTLAGSYHWRGQRGKIYHLFGDYHVSAAVASMPEAFGIFWKGGLLEAADRGGRIDSEPLVRLQQAAASGPPPTVISILHESAFRTDLFPVQCGGRKPDALYTSSNGKRYDLRVETYGGATWLTEYGLLLGISTYYLGDARSLIGYTMENRVRDSLPVQMQRNGYETIALYPSPKSFVNTGRFYKSLGFDKLLDYDDLHASSDYERDKFYYGKAIEQIRKHKASGSRAPLYLFLWTMASHAPYDYVVHPGTSPQQDSICAKDKSWAEYIRRLLIAEDDLAWFKAKLKSEFPDEPFMIVGYGDHQPFISQEFLEKNPTDPFTPVKNTVAYKTFFRISGVNFQPDWSRVPQSIDTPFLGNVMMQAARLPRHGFYNDRDKLLELCQGRYNDCPYQDEILSFHQRMINASTIVNR